MPITKINVLTASYGKMKIKDKIRIIKIIEERISRTKSRGDKEKLTKLEEAVKKGRKEKIKESLKELSSEVAKGLFEARVVGAGYGF